LHIAHWNYTHNIIGLAGQLCDHEALDLGPSDVILSAETLRVKP
jgi:hypothetical protein